MRALSSLFCALAFACTPPPSEGEGEGEGEAQQESEPNDGASLEEVNDVALGVPMLGAIQAVNDADVFFVDTTPGALYRVRLDVDEASQLDGHLTILDAGRGDDAPGADFVKLERAPAGGSAEIEFVSLGVGGDLVVVRDARDVDGGGEGGADFTYSLVVEEEAAEGATIGFPSTTNDVLPSPGGVRLYAFDANANADFTVDLQAAGDLDARLFIYSASEQSWTVRNDDRAVDDVDPLLDAFFPVGGASLLVVESATESPAGLAYTIATTGNAQ